MANICILLSEKNLWSLSRKCRLRPLCPPDSLSFKASSLSCLVAPDSTELRLVWTTTQTSLPSHMHPQMSGGTSTCTHTHTTTTHTDVRHRGTQPFTDLHGLSLPAQAAQALSDTSNLQVTMKASHIMSSRSALHSSTCLRGVP